MYQTSTGPCVLIAEDSLEDKILYREAFKDAWDDASVVFSEGSKNLPDHIRNMDQAPCLIILDFRMQDANGLEILQRLKEDPAVANIPVIIVSGMQCEKTMEACKSAGADRFLFKPDTFDAWVEQVVKLRKYCRRNQMRTLQSV